MKIYVDIDKNYTHEIKYIFNRLGIDRGIDLEFVDKIEKSDLRVGTLPDCDFVISELFYDRLDKGTYNHLTHFTNTSFIHADNGKPDYLSTAFYLINSIQEYDETALDEIGRFQFKNSYQSRFDNVQKNLVDLCFSKICEHPKLSKYSKPTKKTKLFLSHDIDSIYGAWLQDSFYLLNKGNPFPIFSLILNALLQRPDWLNMDQIMKIESEYDLKSTFFWIVNRGRLNKREVNADYSVGSKKLQKIISKIRLQGWENGLHKSISAESLNSELSKLKFTPIANRNHYLKFSLPNLYNEIESSSIRLDSSLGFAESYGFRNSYGLPFRPFNIKNKTTYSFLEVPLTIMDGTLHRYMNIPIKETATHVIDFIEKNKTNCLLSLLWHNTHFTNYKYEGFLAQYKKILEYLSNNSFESINPSQIIREYK
jgi:hypothetical protein